MKHFKADFFLKYKIYTIKPTETYLWNEPFHNSLCPHNELSQ
jgi:hypothetical protein